MLSSYCCWCWCLSGGCFESECWLEKVRSCKTAVTTIGSCSWFDGAGAVVAVVFAVFVVAVKECRKMCSCFGGMLFFTAVELGIAVAVGRKQMEACFVGEVVADWSVGSVVAGWSRRAAWSR